MLTVVPTPIGNLEDITLRAINELKNADLIVAEDTRTSAVLLKHIGVGTHMIAFHKFNEHKTVESIVQKIKMGLNVALISDAGTPAISDPGYLLVRECVKEDINVICLPGPTAFTPAIVASAIPCDKFIFEGFIPTKKGRQTKLKQLANHTYTFILYESPHRLLKTLSELKEHLDENRLACVSREISKKFETHHRGTLAELVNYFTENNPKGEIVITVQGNNAK